MAKVRLIPKLLLKKSEFSSTPRMVLVTTLGFEKTIEIGDPVSQAKIYEAQAADELLFLQLDSKTTSREVFLDVIRRTTEEIFMPFTVGGGVKSVDDFRLYLSNGADKVSINTAAVNTPHLITEASTAFGAQCVVLSIDAKRKPDGSYSVWIENGKVETPLSPIEWAKRGETLGAGEILITSITSDGTRQGLDLELTQKVANAVKIPVIAGGGCGTAQHFIDGFQKTPVSAITAGTYFCFKDENPMQTRARVKNAGIPIRTVV